MAAEEAGARDLLTISSEHRLRSENLPFDIDVWYVFYYLHQISINTILYTHDLLTQSALTPLHNLNTFTTSFTLFTHSSPTFYSMEDWDTR
jgi:hypothetical protein